MRRLLRIKPSCKNIDKAERALERDPDNEKNQNKVKI